MKFMVLQVLVHMMQRLIVVMLFFEVPITLVLLLRHQFLVLTSTSFGYWCFFYEDENF